MPRKLTTVASDFAKCVRESKKLASDAYTWSVPASSTGSAFINAKRRDSITELAFFRTVRAWEAFLEETFILYMLGQQAPKGKKAVRYGFPPNEKAAHEWVADGKRYASWQIEHVRSRSKRLFKNGHPYDSALTLQKHLLEQVTTVRNAIAHESADARAKFEVVVRNELSALPPHTTVGSFLLTTKPRTTPPVSYFEYYINQISIVASMIVPI